MLGAHQGLSVPKRSECDYQHWNHLQDITIFQPMGVTKVGVDPTQKKKSSSSNETLVLAYRRTDSARSKYVAVEGGVGKDKIKINSGLTCLVGAGEESIIHRHLPHLPHRQRRVHSCTHSELAEGIRKCLFPARHGKITGCTNMAKQDGNICMN